VEQKSKNPRRTTARQRRPRKQACIQSFAFIQRNAQARISFLSEISQQKIFSIAKASGKKSIGQKIYNNLNQLNIRYFSSAEQSARKIIYAFVFIKYLFF